MLFRRTSRWPTWDWSSPFEEMNRIRRQIDLLSEGLSRGGWREPAAGVFPLINVTEDKQSFFIRAELPGFKGSDLDISVTGDTLSISGERKITPEDEEATYHRREREAGKFSRIVSLPAQVDTGKVEAGCTDGILQITMPKAEAAKPKQIAVKIS